MYWRIAEGSTYFVSYVCPMSHSALLSRNRLPRLSKHASMVCLENQLSFSFGTISNQQEQECLDFRKDTELANLIAKVCSSRNEGTVYESLMHDPDLRTTQVTHHLIGGLLDRFKDDWKASLGIFEWAKTHRGYKPLPVFYDQVVDTLGKMKQMEKMRAFVEEMKKDGLVSVNTIAKILRRLAGAGEWRDAIRTFHELESFGLEKSTESMNQLLDTLCKEKKVEQARELFFDLKSSIPPNANTFNIFIHGWCKMNMVDEAHWTIQEMKGHGCQPCVISYSTLINSYCQQCNFVRVYELLDEMKGENIVPNVVTFTTILSSLTKSGAFKEALKISDRMKSTGCQPDTLFYNALLHALGRAGKVKEAVRVFEVEMPKIGIARNTSTYNTMIALFCRHGQVQKALEVLRKMECSSPPHCCKPDVQSYCPLLKSCFTDGKSIVCLRKSTDETTNKHHLSLNLYVLMDEMTNKHHLSFNLSTYSLLIHGLCRAKKIEDAYNIFLEMISQDITPRYQTCRYLLDEVKQKSMLDAADVVENLMKKMTQNRSKKD